MNVIAKISCYFKRSVVTLKLRKEYLNFLKYSDIQYTSLTPDKILNSLIYRTLLYVNIYGSYKLLKTVRFFWPALYTFRAAKEILGLILSGVYLQCVELYLSVCLVDPLTFESLAVETSLLLDRNIFKISRSSFYVKIIGSMSRLLELNTKYTH